MKAPDAPPSRPRRPRTLLGPGGSAGNFEQRGARGAGLADLYHHLLTAGWGRLIGQMAVGFTAFNLIFALLYLAGGDCINASEPGNLLLAFSFSVQTAASIGYGAMAPTTPWAYLLSNLEGFLGLIGMAMASGLMFAKFSRPTARISFSSRAVVNDRNGVPTLQFRMSNERGNQIVEAQLSVVALIDEVTAEGERLRRLVDLKLLRDRTPMFSLSWVAMHPIVPGSPLFGRVGPEGVAEDLVAIVVNLTGTDDTMVQTVHARQLYGPDDLHWGMRFVDMLENSDDGHIIVHHRRIDDIERA